MTSVDLPRHATATPSLAASAERAGPWLLTGEHLAYLLLGVVALFAHVWALGDRALHHDETLHASYSWFLLVGRGYIHDPLLHGPLLYYLGAIGYFLFGDNDFTARLMPALAGTALTLTPYLLRRELGRPAALLAAVYLLVSPVSLYVGRFFRHDIYSVLCEILVFVGIVRYVSTRQFRWLMVGAAAFGLMFINHESSYLFLLIMLAPLTVVFLWQVYRPGIALVALLGVVVAALIFVVPGRALVDGGHHAIRDPETGAMQIERPGLFGWPPLPTDDNGYALLVRNRDDASGGRGLFANLVIYVGELLRFFAHPAVVLATGLGLATLSTLIYLIWRRPGVDGQTPWELAYAQEAPAAQVFASLGGERRWLPPLLLFVAIYLVGFTAFFTNILGAISGVAGSLLYWLAQHNVERGGQPGHYYLFLLGVYEPLLLIFGGIGLILVGIWLVQHVRGVDETQAVTPVNFAVLLVAWWSLASLGMYTWAGEKMPWLTIHITLPFTLLAGWTVQQLVWGRHARPTTDAPLPTVAPRPAWVIYGALFTAISGLGFTLMTMVVTYGEEARLYPWMVVAATLVLIALLTVGIGLRWGSRAATGMLVTCVVLALSVYTVRSTVRLVYVNGDVPREPMVYTQTSPDVMRVVRRVEEASIRRGRGLAMPVIYDNETVWTWYLRNFSNARRVSGTLGTAPGNEVMAVFLLQENLDRFPENRTLLEGFVVQRYPLRWWFPEDQVYRLGPGWRDVPLEQASLVGQLLRNPFDRQVGERWWRFLIFRDPGAALGSSDFVIAVRPELANQIGIGLSGQLDGGTR
ncbi:flippase activity-associated protein Agl23 [Candidatus Chloroploca asiatica]|uniref:Glycosyl transferase n=1 Tax=Candidatus Chloroploca asiatica TaxID=1506545 RepID=A0A2H3KSW6_9CHLR|nr:flippase activity-associated protein Agl23 [Candidatus Chloroploca asiatica]PDV96952.1 glycosyl transferase [Candidatus Chloroploca asiatica]